jgi:hypothetical protein
MTKVEMFWPVPEVLSNPRMKLLWRIAMQDRVLLRHRVWAGSELRLITLPSATNDELTLLPRAKRRFFTMSAILQDDSAGRDLSKQAESTPPPLAALFLIKFDVKVGFVYLNTTLLQLKHCSNKYDQVRISLVSIN